jgi:predicted thioesterase
MKNLEPGASATYELVVAPHDLASALSDVESFPPVFATSRMIAAMEVAASRMLVPLLEQDQLSVGVRVEITHSAATLPGVAVRATARFVRMEGKLYLFDVVAEDTGGEIGRGTHARAIVSTSRLMEGARRRGAQ